MRATCRLCAIDLSKTIARQKPAHGAAVSTRAPISQKDMCISCGNYSPYCEMGIDVGMCAHVCPRGVRKLEVKPDRFKGGTSIRVYAVDL